MRYNPPPNWPAPPPGWSPPDGWQPEASWPPPPPNWQFWVPDQGPQRSKKGLLIGGIVAAVAVLAITATILVLVLNRETEPTDEEQIRAVVAGLEDAWKEPSYEKFRALLCEESLDSEYAPTQEEFLEQRVDEGPIKLSVSSVEIDGDEAIAEVEENYDDELGPDVEEMDLVLEDGQWKACFT